MLRILLPLLLLALAAVAIQGCSGKRERVTIRYAAWNLEFPEKDNLERRMVRAFMEKYPHILIEMDESFVNNYNEAMNISATNGTIPDVFMFAGNPQANTNGWCADLTKIVSKDREWRNIPLSLREAVQIRGKTIAIPSSVYLYGYFCNDSLFEAAGKEPPKVGYDLERFKRSIAEMTDIPKGRIGLADEATIPEWYPAAVNNVYSWFSWDGGRFHLNSAEFRDGIRLAESVCKGHQSFALLTEEERKLLKGSNDWEAWNAGSVAMKFDGTWVVNDNSRLPFRTSFAGLPGGRTCIVPDFLFVSSKSGHPEEAYQFAKFMSAYSREGFAKRMELADANGLVVSTIPMVRDNKLVDAYFRNVKIDGIREAYEKMDQNSYIEGTKVLPGYSQARWEYETNLKVGDKQDASMGEVILDTFRGSTRIDDVAEQLNSIANECVQIFPKPTEN